MKGKASIFEEECYDATKEHPTKGIKGIDSHLPENLHTGE